MPPADDTLDPSAVRQGEEPDADALERARGPREDLKAAMSALESAIAAPAAAGQERWALRVHDALVDLGAAFERHIAVTESPGGLLERIQRAAPRLACHVDRLAEEHRELRELVTNLLDAACAAAATTERDAPRQVREQAQELLRLLSQHRQAGADLVYEAYQVDIGAGD